MSVLRRQRPFFLTWILCNIGYFGYGLGMVVFLVVILPVVILLRPFKRLFETVVGNLLRPALFFLTRIYLPMLGIYRVAELSGFGRVPGGKAAIYIANHRGRLDGLLLLGTIKKAGAVMKARYAAMPFYGALVANCNFVSVDPAALSSLAGSIERSREVLAKGINLIVFPEGTRANTSRLLPFKELAFRMAMETGADLVPVVIHSELPFMARVKGSYYPRYCFDYRIRCLGPMRAQPGESASDFAERVRRQMIAELKNMNHGGGETPARQGK
jgi:1-acyl-sn-glycerol-3-phosphate acyltransferase